jgi:deoxyadenosine/deoxycytidine kinase
MKLGPAKCIAVSGNMGAGKSTLVEFLKSHFPIKPLLEPNEENPYLKDFYADMPRWAFHSQVFFLIRKFHLHQEMAASAGPVILDRTIYEDGEIFAAQLADMGMIPPREYATYRSLYETLVELLRPPDLLIHLACPLSSVKKRIVTRGRPEEQNVPETYVRSLHRRYDRWYKSYNRSPTLVIRTDKIDYVSDMIYQSDVLQIIEAYILGKPVPESVTWNGRKEGTSAEDSR